MAKEFDCRVMTPERTVAGGAVSEVILPAYDGQCGILAEHEDRIGLLGSGVLRMQRRGKDFFLVVSGGLFSVRDGNLTVLAETAETSQEIDIEKVERRKRELEAIFSDVELFSAEDYPAQAEEHRMLEARIEVARISE